MSDDIRVPGALLSLGGLLAVYGGFRRLRLKKLVEGLATSKVRSMAVGLVELSGTARPTAAILDPIFKEPCVLFHVLVEEHRGSGKSSRWVTVYEADSYETPFRLEDETGAVHVFPQGVDAFLSDDVSETTGSLFSSVPEPVVAFARGVAGGGSAQRRVTAQIVRDGEPVYVLGYAAPADDPFTFREKLAARAAVTLNAAARLLKRSPERIRALDKNADGRLDPEEWDSGLRAFHRELQEAAERGAPEDVTAEGDPTLIVRGSPEGLLVISDRSEEDLVSQLGGTCVGLIVGGALAAVGGAAMLLLHYGLL